MRTILINICVSAVCTRRVRDDIRSSGRPLVDSLRIVADCVCMGWLYEQEGNRPTDHYESFHGAMVQITKNEHAGL